MSNPVQANPHSYPIGHAAARVQPGRTEPIARGFIEFLGGPLGRHARVGTQSWWTPLRVLLMAACVGLSAGFLSKFNCTQGSWSGHKQYVSACYNDILPLYRSEGFADHHFPYAYSWVSDGQVRYMEYPVITGMFQWFNAQLTHVFYPLYHVLGGHALAENGFYFAVTAFTLSLCWMVAVRIMVWLTGNRVWDTVLMAITPLVAIHAFTNFELLVIMFAVAALALAAQGKYRWAGVAIGLGTAAKLWPLFLLGAYLVILLREKRLVPMAQMVGTTILSWLAVNLPIMFLFPVGWHEFFRLNSERGWEWTTIYAFASRTFGWHGFDHAGTYAVLNMFTLGMFLLSCLGIALIGWFAPQTPRVAQLAYLIVAVFLLWNKVWSPQYSLWLVPLAVLAVPRWRLVLCWGLIDALLWPILTWHMLGEKNMGIPHGPLDLAILGRDGMIVALGVIIVLEMYGKLPDRVRAAHGGIDPIGPGARRPARQRAALQGGQRGVEKQRSSEEAKV